MLFHLFVVKFTLVISFFFFLHNGFIIVKEVKLVVAVNDLNFRIKDVAFEAKVLNRYGTFDQIANRSM